MDNVKDILMNRRSYRNYTCEEISEEIIKEVLMVAQKTATSVNGQQISIVVTRDKKILKKISEIGWGQKHIENAEIFITFVVDYNRSGAHLENLEIVNHVESILVGAVDAGLIAQSVELLFQEQGIGTCLIGGVRNDMPKLRELLKIDGNAFPVLGMTVGRVSNFKNIIEKMRPRVDVDSYYFIEEYNRSMVIDSSIKYDKQLTEWWKNQKLEGHRSYSESMKNFYSRNYIENEFEQLQEMGFMKAYEKTENK